METRAPVEPPPIALYAVAGLAIIFHAGACFIVLAGAVAFLLAFGFVIMMVTLGFVRSIFLEGLNLIWPPQQLFWMLLTLATIKPIALVLTVLALRSARWAQLALAVMLGLITVADLGASIYWLFEGRVAVQGPLLLMLVGVGQLFLLWQLEGKRRFAPATCSG